MKRFFMVNYTTTLTMATDSGATAALNGEIYLSTDGDYPNRQKVRERIEQECRPMYEVKNIAVNNILEFNETDFYDWINGSGVDL